MNDWYLCPKYLAAWENRFTKKPEPTTTPAPKAHSVNVDDPGCQATTAETLSWVNKTLEGRGK